MDKKSYGRCRPASATIVVPATISRACKHCIAIQPRRLAEDTLTTPSINPNLFANPQGLREKTKETAGKLDFDARVPIPFSVFPSTYRSDNSSSEKRKVSVEASVYDSKSGPGSERAYFERASVRGPAGSEEEIHVHREGRHREFDVDYEKRRLVDDVLVVSALVADAVQRRDWPRPRVPSASSRTSSRH